MNGSVNGYPQAKNMDNTTRKFKETEIGTILEEWDILKAFRWL